jgi:hypothetical protein
MVFLMPSLFMASFKPKKAVHTYPVFSLGFRKNPGYYFFFFPLFLISTKKMSTRVYIGRLARDATKRDLERLFKNYGDIREINVKTGFGFVEFADERDAKDVVYDFHGKNFLGER